MKIVIFGLLTLVLTAQAANSAETPAPTGMLGNGVIWSIGDNEALPLVRGEQAAYSFGVTKGRVTLDVDGKTVGNISGGLLLEGKVIRLTTKFSSGVAATGYIQRVAEFKLNSPGIATRQALMPATFPLARFSTPRAFAFTVEGPPEPDRQPEECRNTALSYVKLILDGEILKEHGSSDVDARLPRNGGYMGKAKDIDWAIAGPQSCVYTVMFTPVAE